MTGSDLILLLALAVFVVLWLFVVPRMGLG